jgi:hypothetical protein
MSTETTAATPAELAGEITTWAVGGHRGALSAGVADHHPDRGRPRSRSCWFRSPSAWSSLSSRRRFSRCGACSKRSGFPTARTAAEPGPLCRLVRRRAAVDPIYRRNLPCKPTFKRSITTGR